MSESQIQFGKIVYYSRYSKHGFILGENSKEYFFIWAWEVQVDWSDVSPTLSNVTDKTEPRVGERVLFYAQPARTMNERLRAIPWAQAPTQRTTPRRLPVLRPEQPLPPRSLRPIDTLLVRKSEGNAETLKALLLVRESLSEAAALLFCDLTPSGRELLADLARVQQAQADPAFGWVEYAEQVVRKNVLKIIGPRSCELEPKIRIRTWMASFKEGLPDDATLLSIYLEEPKMLRQYPRACTGCKMTGCKHYRSGYLPSKRPSKRR